MFLVKRTLNGRIQHFFMLDKDEQVIYEATASDWVGPIDIPITNGSEPLLSLCFSMDIMPSSFLKHCFNVDIFDQWSNFIGSIRPAQRKLFFQTTLNITLCDSSILARQSNGCFQLLKNNQLCGKIWQTLPDQYSVHCEKDQLLLVFALCIMFLFQNPITSHS